MQLVDLKLRPASGILQLFDLARLLAAGFPLLGELVSQILFRIREPTPILDVTFKVAVV
jgi:hypothetical protein